MTVELIKCYKKSETGQANTEELEKFNRTRSNYAFSLS